MVCALFSEAGSDGCALFLDDGPFVGDGLGRAYVADKLLHCEDDAAAGYQQRCQAPEGRAWLGVWGRGGGSSADVFFDLGCLSVGPTYGNSLLRDIKAHEGAVGRILTRLRKGRRESAPVPSESSLDSHERSDICKWRRDAGSLF